MSDLDLAELERLAKAELEKPEPRYLTSFDYPAEVDESNLDDLTRYLFDAGADWANWNSAGTVLALMERLREAEARIEKVVRLRDRMERQRDDIDESVRLSTILVDLNAALTEGDER